jgi:MFS family permease
MSAVSDAGPSSIALLTHLDEALLRRYHWRTVVTMGTGFFTDAYDLFVIGIVTSILTPVWHLNTWQISLINSTALLSAAIGAMLFGYLMDRLGRRTMYGIEALLLTLGALISGLLRQPHMAPGRTLRTRHRRWR